MKIKLSKNQWEYIGKKSGWLKLYSNVPNILNRNFTEEEVKQEKAESGKYSCPICLKHYKEDNKVIFNEGLGWLQCPHCASIYSSEYLKSLPK